MNTVYINGKFTAQRITGVQRAARELVAALDRRLGEGAAPSHTRWVLLCPPTGNLPVLRHIEVHCLGWRWMAPTAWEQLLLPLACGRGLLLGLSGSAPALKGHQVCTWYDAAVFDHPGAYRKSFVAWYRFLFRRLGRAAALVLTSSEFSRGRLMHHLGVPARRIQVVHGGGEHLCATPADASIVERLGLRPGRYFVAVGSASANKNHGALVQAFAMLAAADTRLVIVGAADARVFTGAAVGVAAHDTRIVRAGPVSDAELKGLYAQAAALVFPSLYEGFGLPPLEAMSCGCPVIASDAGALPEVCADAALYVDPRSVAAIAGAMQSVLDHPALRERLKRDGARRVAELTWSRSAGTLLEALAENGLIEGLAR
ncbi:MAG TPA: glycosyltransferase family 1 protein [Albitalea sp.]|uniref:glycosyltransferase family 4 protein n=1 Tax=Piscinibacter sp. TaxID=1903157 RepID=UPI002ED38A43